MLKHIFYIFLFNLILISQIFAQEESDSFGSTDVFLEEELLFSEEDLVTTGSRRARKKIEAPGVVSILTQEQIKMSGAKTFYELLEQIPGVDVFIHSNDPSLNQVTIRGLIFGSDAPVNRILTMINGSPIYNTLYYNTDWTYLPLAIEEIQRIEVVKGPGSALYGTNAFLGIINIITLDPEKNKISKVNSGYGDNGEAWLTAFHTTKIKDAHFRFSANGYSHGGFFETDTVTGIKKESLQKAMFSIDGVYDLSRDWKVRLYSGVGYGEGVTTAYDSTPQDDAETLSYFFHLQNNWTLGEKTWVNINSFFNKENTDFSKSAFQTVTNTKGDPSIPKFESLVSEVEVSFAHLFKKRHFLYSSASFRLTEGEGFILPERDISSKVFGFSLLDEIEVNEKFLVQIGGKIEKHSDVDAQISYKTNGVYKATENSVFRFGIGNAFRVPSVGERNFDLKFPIVDNYHQNITGTGSIIGNKNLEAEKITTTEVGYEGKFEKLVVKSDFFRHEVSDLIRYEQTIELDTLSDGSIFGTVQSVAQNSENIDGIGFENEISYQLTNWFSLYANYSVQFLEEFVVTENTSTSGTEKTLTGQRVLFAPKEKANFGFRSNFKGWNMHSWIRYVSQRVDNNEKLNDYAHLNLVIEKLMIRDKVAVSFIGYRLLDLLNDDDVTKVSRKDFADGASLGRDLRINVEVKF
ncbi:MAG: TonB-dependent receptor [Calditrichaeota bacterium]|nr:MAG: TonB-dependent receptor [Calditrichota bacterium]